MPSWEDACSGVPGSAELGICSAEQKLKTVQHSAIRNMQIFREDGIFFFKKDFRLYAYHRLSGQSGVSTEVFRH